MNPLKHELDRGLGCSIISEYSKSFVRPEQLSIGNIPAKTAGATQSLRFRPIGFASSQRVLRPLAIVQIGRGAVPTKDVSIFVAQRIVAEQEPAISPVVSELPPLELEGNSACEPALAFTYEQFQVFGMTISSERAPVPKDVHGKIPAVVVEQHFVRIETLPIRSKDEDELGNN